MVPESYILEVTMHASQVCGCPYIIPGHSQPCRGVRGYFGRFRSGSDRGRFFNAINIYNDDVTVKSKGKMIPLINSQGIGGCGSANIPAIINIRRYLAGTRIAE